MSMKCLFLSILCFKFASTVRATGDLRKTEITNPEALCNDNSRAVYYVDDGKRSSKGWLIFFESGGLCASKADCNRRYKNKNSTVLMTSNKLPEIITGRDLLSTSENENPAFYDYGHILVPYCSSDLWLGASTAHNDPFVFMDNSSVNNFIFRGKTIFRSVFSDLMSHLSSAEHIVVCGSSAGGIGVLNHAKWLSSSFLATSSAKLSFIIDSAWFINFQDGFSSRVKPEFINLANISASSCLDLTYGFSCCLSASCLLSRDYFPSDIPVAFISSLYDIYMFAEELRRLENEGKTVEDNVADFISLVSMYGGAMNESFELPKNAADNASFFIPACFQHTYLSTSSLWDEDGVLNHLIEVTRGTGIFSHKVKSGTWSSTKITKGHGTISIQDFVTEWSKSRNRTSKVIDSCIGAHCNPTCPDKIVFLDVADTWNEIVKAVIICLSLVITIFCSGLKGAFVFYYFYLTKRQKRYLDDSETSQARKELPLCKADDAVSLACLFLSYAVDVKKKKKTVKNESGPESTTDFAKEEATSEISLHTDSGSSEGEDESEETPAWTLPRKLTNGSTDDVDFVFSPQERKQGSFSSSDKNSSLRSRAGSDAELLPGYHGNGGYAPLSPSSPVSKDATDFPERKDATSTKKILKSVSAYFNTGELVAIMGPSGCGKTTLLDLLTGRRRHGHIEGQVYVNGVGLGQVQDWYARKIGYVLQLAVPYYEELTVRQNLFFAAHMRLPKKTSTSEKYERVEQIIAETGLTQMADTVIGGSIGPGLSGGQKRRLCVALQLINMPSVLFLDEPTSGLDASSSLELLNHLNLVAESGRLVILTIHQPRLEIFHLFHKILFLCDGQVAYYGEPSMAPEIFIKAYARATTKAYRLSEEAPKIDAKNPADTIMDLLNCPEARHAILDYYQGSGEPQAVQEAIVTSQENARKTFAVDTMTKSTVDGAGRFNRVFVLEGRTAEKQSLGQLLYFPLIFFAFGVIVGTVYFRAEERDGILLMSAYCVYCCASPLFLSSVLMAHLNKALNIYHLERADGCGRSLENVIQTFVRTTAFCVLPVILCSLMSYFMVMMSYDPGRLVLVTIISLVLNQTWIAVYMMVICAQPQIAHRICPMVSAIGGFAGGFLVPRPQMPIVYSLLFYINPQFYGYAAITKVLLKNVRLTCDYDSTLSCISTDGNAVLTRFGLDTVNPYENLVIMLGMTVLSLLLSWLFLEAKYFKLRCFSKTTRVCSQRASCHLQTHFKRPPSFLVDVPEEQVEVLVEPVEPVEPGEPVEPVDDTPAKEENNDVELKTSFVSRPGINRRSTNRTSAKSRLGLIRENEGFHSVKLPAPSNPRAQSPEMTFATANEQSIDGENQEFRTQRSRLLSVSGDKLWKHTKLQMRERKVNLEQRMSMVQNIANQYSIKHSQSMRKRQSKKPPSAPRRTTLASSAASEVKRKDFAPRHYGKLREIPGNSLFREELEELPEPPLDDPASDGDIIDGGMGASAKEDGVGVGANSTVVVPETQENQQGNLDPSFKETLQGDTSSQHVNTIGEDSKPLKSVSIAGFTEILDV